MKIGVYGCSWCAGVAPDYFSWAKNLAQICPMHEINNYSLGGFSIEAILYWFERFKDYNDINIVKLTTHHRLTIIPQNNSAARTQVTEIYSEWNKNFTETMTRLHANSTSCSHAKLHKFYYKYYNSSVGTATARAMAEYLKNHKNVHMIFAHNRAAKLYPNIEQSTEQFLPNFYSYIIDNGEHLSYEGTQLEAEYIKNYLINKQLIN